MKFELNWSSGFKEEDVWTNALTNGRMHPEALIQHTNTSSPVSLRLTWTWANKISTMMRVSKQVHEPLFFAQVS